MALVTKRPPGLIGRYVQVACIWESTARKPGNVHPSQGFGDAAYLDFLLSAAAIGPVLEAARDHRVGQTVLDAVRATREVVATNTNLGIVLLLAPLATVGLDRDLRTELAEVLDGMDVEDSRLVYRAIRLAAPAGLGSVGEEDIHDQPTRPLRAIMALASERDLVARQYANGFHQVLDDGVGALRQGLQEAASLEAAIVYCHLSLMALYPDSLIARKRGLPEAEAASRRARRVLEAGWPASQTGGSMLTELDAWLREEGNARNPGTTADLVAASLFVALRQGIIKLPVPWPWALT